MPGNKDKARKVRLHGGFVTILGNYFAEKTGRILPQMRMMHYVTQKGGSS